MHLVNNVSHFNVVVCMAHFSRTIQCPDRQVTREGWTQYTAHSLSFPVSATQSHTDHGLLTVTAPSDARNTPLAFSNWNNGRRCNSLRCSDWLPVPRDVRQAGPAGVVHLLAFVGNALRALGEDSCGWY